MRAMACAAAACIVGFTVLDTGRGARPAHLARIATVCPVGSTTVSAPDAEPRSAASFDCLEPALANKLTDGKCRVGLGLRRGGGH